MHPAEDMNEVAANALLKGLEEPPSGAIFILVSHRPARLLPTIRSRCVAFPVPLPARDVALKWLAGQNVKDAERWLAYAGGAPLRAAFIYWSNGTIPQEWTPEETGSGFRYSTILKPLEPFRSRTVVLSGLDNTVEGTHPTASSGWLTGVSAKPTEGDDVYNNTSIDQVIAAHVGRQTLLPSLEVMTEDFSSAIGSCAGGYSCIYANTISWASPTTPLPMELNPRSVFERMFGRAGTAAQRASRLRRQESILDSVGREIGTLQGRVGPGDRRRLLRLLKEEARRVREESPAVPPPAPETQRG